MIGIGVGIGFRSTAPSSPFILQDTFTGANGSLLSARSPAWADAGASLTFGIQNNKAVVLTLGGSNVGQSNIQSSVSNCTIECDLTWGTGAASGLNFRSDGTANNRFSWVSMETGTQTKLEITVAGAKTDLEFLPASFVNGVTYHMKVVLLGSSIKCYLDGVLKHDIINTNLMTNTKHGLSAWVPSLPTSTAWDNFLVS